MAPLLPLCVFKKFAFKSSSKITTNLFNRALNENQRKNMSYVG